MNKNSTQQDLLRYAYNETSLPDADRIQRAIDGDPLIQQEYTEITEVISKLDKGRVQPGDEVIRKILEASRNA